MSKYMVLFVGSDITDKDLDGSVQLHVPKDMVFGYLDERHAWTFDSAEGCHKEAQENDYVHNKDYIVVRVITTKPKKDSTSA